MSAVWKRLATTAVLLPLVVWLVLGGPPWLFHALVIALSGAAVWELGRMLERTGGASAGWLGVALGVLVTGSFAIDGAPVAALALAVVVTMTAPLASRRALATDVTVTRLFGVAYVSWLLGHGILLRELPGGGELVLFLAGVTWVGESSAYAVGSMIGRHKLAPVVSPGKTVEGGIAQVLASVLGSLLLGFWLVPGWSARRVVAAGVLLGVVGQIGDLAESVVKRSVGAKDTGGLIPGHGGVLDRLDGLLFNTPAFFYFVTFQGAVP
ncbi:MAG: phosphatidate cytidylyltransferase [Candidatus Rokubacteria bacterium]|nr:phosphatidate cytidylyltransferase [Candidatus Rokubacteria bacterium]